MAVHSDASLCMSIPFFNFYSWFDALADGKLRSELRGPGQKMLFMCFLLSAGGGRYSVSWRVSVNSTSPICVAMACVYSLRILSNDGGMGLSPR